MYLYVQVVGFIKWTLRSWLGWCSIVWTHKHNTSVNNTIFIFIYNGIYVRATCFDLGHPQALQENRSKSCLVFLHCGIPNAYKVLLQEHIYYIFYVPVTEPCKHLGSQNAGKLKQLLDVFSWRA